MKEFDIVGFGALNYDRLHIVNKMPEAGDEIVIRKIVEDAGGSAANTIVGLARLGLKTGFIGMVSFDDEARWIMERFETDKVDTRGISITSGGRTGLCEGYVDRQGERALTIYPGVNDMLEITDINLGYAKKAKFIHLSSFVSNKQLKEQISLIRKLSQEEPKIKFSLTPGMIYVRKGIEKLNPFLKHCDVLFLAENEIKLLTGLEYRHACNALLKKGVKIIVVTLGVKGCYIISGNKSEFIGSREPKKVVDTTGAGDAFAAGFLYGLLKNQNLHKCGVYGNWVASECVAKYGARKGLVYSINNFKHSQVSLLEILKNTSESAKHTVDQRITN